MRLSFRVIAGIIIIALSIFTLAVGGFAQVSETNWTGQSQDEDTAWELDENWDNGVPDPDKDAYIHFGGMADPTIYSDAFAKNLYLTKPLTIESNLTVTYDMVVGRDGTGQVDQWSSTVSAQNLIVGDYVTGSNPGYGTFNQSNPGITNTFGNLVLGLTGGDLGNGTYNLNNAGDLEITDKHLMVGDAGRGYFNHNLGYITLTDTAQLIIGNQFQGEYNHTAGAVFALGGVVLGQEAGSEGTYTMVTGFPEGTQLLVGTNAYHDPYNIKDLVLGHKGKGTFNQYGGFVEVTGNLSLGQGDIEEGPRGEGHYTMGDSHDGDGNYHAAALRVFGKVVVGENGQGSFHQDAGSLTTYSGLVVGKEVGSQGEFVQTGGTAEVNGFNAMIIGESGTGSFIQTGGSLEAVGTVGKIVLGLNPGSYGTIEQDLNMTGSIKARELIVGQNGVGNYQMYGGSLEVDRLAIGIGTDTFSRGIMDVHSFNASVTIKESLTIGEHGEFRTGPGVIINMTGSNFYNYSKDPSAVDMTGATMKFSNDPATPDTFEVAGTNGLAFDDNFALGTLELSPGNVILVDEVDNNNSGSLGDEVLYVTLLILGVDSTLDLNHFYLFCQAIQYNGGKLLNAEHLVQLSAVPLPGAVWLLGSGLLGLVGVRRFRKR